MRELEPTRVPISCERCGKVDLLPENEDVWEFICTFPGVMTTTGMSSILRVDYGAVREIAGELGIMNKAELIMKLEAVGRGYSGGK